MALEAGPRAAAHATTRPTGARSVREALKACRPLFFCVAVFGAALNFLMLVGPLYMLQVYDRVLISGSAPTLVALTVIVVIAYAAFMAIEDARERLCARAGLRLDQLLAEQLVRGAWRGPDAPNRAAELVNNLDTWRKFVSGPGLIVVTDLPFTPLFIAVIFLIHPVLGWFAVGATGVLLCLALITRYATKDCIERATVGAIKTNRLLHTVSAASEAVRALGMTGVLAGRWRRERDAALGEESDANDRGSTLRAATKATRLLVQSLILGLAAFLALSHLVSPGAMIAATIILGRALAPIDQAVRVYLQLGAAVSARRKLDQALADMDSRAAPSTPLPPIEGMVSAKQLTVAPDPQRPIVSEIDFTIPAGTFVGVVGPSGAGKTTLARALVGAIEPTAGQVLFDGAEIRFYDPHVFGAAIGYLPQDVQLLSGTVQENIARFEPGRAADAVAAAQRAGVHELILRLPDGYDTQIGPEGVALSAGQRQRIGLARALFGPPRFIVLDEPNANLDRAGELALARTLMDLRQDGVGGLLITHRNDILSQVDGMIVMEKGRITQMGPRAKVISALRTQNTQRGLSEIRSRQRNTERPTAQHSDAIEPDDGPPRAVPAPQLGGESRPGVRGGDPNGGDAVHELPTDAPSISENADGGDVTSDERDPRGNELSENGPEGRPARRPRSA